MAKDKNYYVSLEAYCKKHTLRPMIIVGKHLLMLDKSDKPLICHYRLVGKKYKVDSIKKYSCNKVAIGVMNRFICKD